MKVAKKLGFVVFGITSTLVSTAVIAGTGISKAQAVQINLVQNGDFEADPLVNPNYDPTLPNPFITGWNNDSQFDGGYTDRLENYPNPATNGLLSVHLGYTPPGSFAYLTQTLATQNNNEYKLTFSLASAEEPPRLDNLFQVYAGGTKIFELTDLTLDPAQPYKEYSVNFVATSTATDLKFATQVGHDWLNLDDVSVYKVENDNSQSLGSTAVPEPTTIGGIAVAGILGSRLKRKKLANG
ncbi:DUF642 domain-containing protein [Nostoc sp. CENA67]|uniref:DUF642 domain-containing protein n=1 Tax=Amazonocrinis nigriterrae CENA67 TaxID=2794033 RepID=A0A8J7L8V8_9NOST|nr:DUF642 domain-containing protein [Amazonocrinis nigriterrae]MBH8560781.1 DUF642 domain-containing protein [Amazonocrinis nigriterrae CENA67]